MAKRTIKIRSFRSRDPETRKYSPWYMRGETVDLPAWAIEQGDAVGAFKPAKGEKVEEEKPAGPVLAADFDDDALLAYWESDHPTIPKAINMADGDPEQAKRILAVEDAYTGGTSRKTLVEGLAAIVGGANQ